MELSFASILVIINTMTDSIKIDDLYSIEFTNSKEARRTVVKELIAKFGSMKVEIQQENEKDKPINVTDEYKKID